MRYCFARKLKLKCQSDLSAQMICKINASGTGTSSSSVLATFPIEILCMIVELLEPVDRIVLALAAKYFAQIVILKGTIMERSSKPTYGNEKDPVVTCWENLLPRLSDLMPASYHICRGKDGKVFKPTFCPDWLQDFQAGKQAREREDYLWICTSCWEQRTFSEEEVLAIEREKLKVLKRLTLRQETVVVELDQKQKANSIMKDWQAWAYEKGRQLGSTRLVTLKTLK